MNISVIGTGYVGLSTAAVFAELGNTVMAADADRDKIDSLNKYKMPIFEPGLKELVEKNSKKGRLVFTHNNREAIEHGEVIFICVGTPPKDNWEVELKYVEAVALEIASSMSSYKVIVHKSTVPVETGERIKKIIGENIKPGIEFDVVSNPEFLREGTAISDTLQPDRIVVGAESRKAIEIMKKLYSPIKAPLIITDIKSAELIKHASNAFLATKISFINSVAKICEFSGADVEKVAEGMGYDKRIGRHFLSAGIGYGGSCFPKDSQAFAKIAENYGYDYKLLRAANEINESQKKDFVDKVKRYLGTVNGKTIAALGLSFKPNTDDMRFAPSIFIISELQKLGAKIKAYDPAAIEKAKLIFSNVAFCNDAYETCENADALMVLTEWNEFKDIDIKKIKSLLRSPIILDGRNIYNPEEMQKEGFTYISMGRKPVFSDKTDKMEAIILAAGYATRLYPLTEDTPKPLLKVAGRPMVEHIIAKLASISNIKKIYVITNKKFAGHFIDWKNNFKSEIELEIINDGTGSNEDRLGAIGDINYAIGSKNIESDVLVVAGDNLFDFSLAEVSDKFKEKKSNIILLHDVRDKNLARNYGVVSVKNGVISNFVEKPDKPDSTLISTGIYFFPKKTLPLIKKYLDEGNNPDKSGSFIEWLHKKEKVYAYATQNSWYDIGSFEQLEMADRNFKG